ncbi:hypothetical protein EAI_07708, partial [Harpegnathos saltator]
LTCDQCKMISYCGEKHKQMHYTQHMEFCAVIQKLLKSYPYFWATLELNLEDWIQSRKELVHLTKQELSRALKPYEEQMITLAKSCNICRRQEDLISCWRCFSANYCPHHIDDIQKHNCQELRLCYHID